MYDAKNPVALIDGTKLGARSAFSSVTASGVLFGGLALLAKSTGSMFVLASPAIVTTVASAALAFPFIPASVLIGGLIYIGTRLRIPKVFALTERLLSQYSWSIPIGINENGQVIRWNLQQIPHCKVGGATGSGKTKGLEAVITALCMQQSPEHLEVNIVDMKGGASFAHFTGVPHLSGIYADTINAERVFAEIEQEMWRRLELIRRARAAFQPVPTFKRIVVVIDEGGELSPAYAHDKEESQRRTRIMSHLSTLARIGREPCVHLVFGTQRPSNETLPVGIRGQLEFTVCYRTENELDSEIVLRHKGAEKLRHIPGRCIVKTPSHEQECQGVYVPDRILNAWLRSYKQDESPPIEPLDKVDVPSGLPSSPSIPDITAVWE